MRRRSLFALVPVLAVSALRAQDWPMWRGPAGDGIAAGQTVPLTWDRESNIKWRTPLARPGNGSPIVARGRVFLTMPEDDEGKRRSLYSFDREDGKLLWVRTVELDRAMPTHATNPHCSTTPAADGERVVVWHASAGLFCYGFDGDELWRRDLGEFRHEWGHGTSPILHRDRVILHTGPGARSFVAAFRLATGETIWTTDEPDHRTAEQIEKKRLAGSWCTPLICRVGDRDLVLCAQPTRVVAYDAEDGAIAWWCGGLSCERGDLVYSSPVVAGDVCVVMGGYDGPSIGVRLAGRAPDSGGDGVGGGVGDGDGDSDSSGQGDGFVDSARDVTATHRVWRHPKQMSNCASGVFVAGYVYIPDMGSIVHCIDPANGETVWKARVGRGNTWGSIVAAAGRLYMTSQRGTTYVFVPDPTELVILARNALDERTNSTPAIAGGEIFLRTHESLYCVSESR